MKNYNEIYMQHRDNTLNYRTNPLALLVETELLTKSRIRKRERKKQAKLKKERKTSLHNSSYLTKILNFTSYLPRVMNINHLRKRTS